MAQSNNVEMTKSKLLLLWLQRLWNELQHKHTATGFSTITNYCDKQDVIGLERACLPGVLKS